MPATASRPYALPRPPQVVPPRLLRQWYPTRQAAALLGISARTLRRRMELPHWIEGRHYRWIKRYVRPTLEINVPAVVQLMNQRGW